MRHARSLIWIILLGLTVSVGCTHNYYYGGGIPVCEPPGAILGSAPVVSSSPLAYSYGEVCEVPEVPTRVEGGSVEVAEGSGRAKPIVTVREPPARVIVSEPTGRQPSSTRVGWRGRDETQGAKTQISGAYEEGLIR